MIVKNNPKAISDYTQQSAHATSNKRSPRCRRNDMRLFVSATYITWWFCQRRSHLANASANSSRGAPRRLANYAEIMVMRRAGDGFVAVSATSGGRTATLTSGFDFQHGASY